MNRIKELIDTYRYQIMGGSAILLFILIGLLLFQTTRHDSAVDSAQQTSVTNMESDNNLQASSFSTSTNTSETVPTTNDKIIVDVKGAVKHPGIYKVGTDTRVSDLVDLAGGFARAADHKNVNLARRITDQQVIYIPTKGEIKGNLHLKSNDSIDDSTTGQTDSISNSGDSNGKININTADKDKLQTISGVGEKKADNIINYRQQKGAFKSIEDIKNADGIGDKMFENIKDSITV